MVGERLSIQVVELLGWGKLASHSLTQPIHTYIPSRNTVTLARSSKLRFAPELKHSIPTMFCTVITRHLTCYVNLAPTRYLGTLLGSYRQIKRDGSAVLGELRCKQSWRACEFASLPNIMFATLYVEARAISLGFILHFIADPVSKLATCSFI